MSTKRSRNNLMKTVGMDTPGQEQKQEQVRQMPSLVNVSEKYTMEEKIRQAEQAEISATEIMYQVSDSTVMNMHLLVPASQAVAWLDKHLDGKCQDENCLITDNIMSVIKALKTVGSSPRFGLMLIHTILNQENDDDDEDAPSEEDDDEDSPSDDDEDSSEDEDVASWITVEKTRGRFCH